MSRDRDRLATPADLIGARRWDLVHGLDAHEHVLTNARHGIGEQLPAGRVAAAALDALACGRALAENALRFEWVAQLEALRYGASLADVATACGLNPDEVTAGLSSRIAAQVQHDCITRAQADDFLALVERATAG